MITGTSPVIQMVTADGFDYRISSHPARLENEAGQNIDGGVEPHITIDTSKFYDIEYLGQQIDQWYSSKK